MNTTIHAATIRRLGVALLGSTVLLACNPPFAADIESDVPRVTVRFGDLDLSKPQGAEALYRRIRAAAEQVCRRLDGMDLGSKARASDCREKAIADAVNTLNRPALLDLYRAKHRSDPRGIASAALSRDCDTDCIRYVHQRGKVDPHRPVLPDCFRDVRIQI
jgi:UrcA family protein